MVFRALQLALAAANLAAVQGFIGNQACSECHTSIAKSYAQTAMAQTAGRVADLRLPDGTVLAAKANTTYSVTTKEQTTQLSFQKTALQGSKVLQFYIGSGAHGRGFIFEEQGQPFQAPLAYYGGVRGWDVAPGYEGERVVFLSRKTETACIACHATRPKPITAGLFDEGAVECERCHGPGEEHVKRVRAGNADPRDLAIVNPAKLDPERRDSVCAQCHLTGETRVVKPGKSETSFRAGELLADHIVPFVWASPDQSEFKVVGHFEGLWQSKCKRASGERLSCLTCHDPHVTVGAMEKKAFYRQKCLGCHQTTACKAPATARTAKADSCIACHMPERESTDGQHTAFTDHSICRVPPQRQAKGHAQELVPFWKDRATARDYALADADVGNWQKARDELLKVADDDTVASKLAYIYDAMGESDKAEALYQRALRADANDLLALTNLGIHVARHGDVKQAVDLWKRALAIDPGLLAPGLNVARIEWRLGEYTEAREAVRRVLSLNPDSEAALALQRQMQRQP